MDKVDRLAAWALGFFLLSIVLQIVALTIKFVTGR